MSRSIEEHDRVVLTESIPEHALHRGDVGTVVHVYENHDAFEVEFVTLTGRTMVVATVEATQVRPVADDELAHARAVDAG